MIANPTPNGCRWCGIEKLRHYQRWTEPVGWHGHVEPTDDQRLARMLARRTERQRGLAAKFWTGP